jgi:hypothetical protein
MMTISLNVGMKRGWKNWKKSPSGLPMLPMMHSLSVGRFLRHGITIDVFADAKNDARRTAHGRTPAMVSGASVQSAAFIARIGSLTLVSGDSSSAVTFVFSV